MSHCFIHLKLVHELFVFIINILGKKKIISPKQALHMRKCEFEYLHINTSIYITFVFVRKLLSLKKTPSWFPPDEALLPSASRYG